MSGELHAINDANFYAGTATDECTFGPQAYRAGRGEFGGSNVYQVLDPPGVIHSHRFGINAVGDVVGNYYISDAYGPFLWPAGASSSTFTPLNNVAWEHFGTAYGVNGSSAVGQTVDGKAFRWTAQGGMKALTSSKGDAHAVNTGGAAVGYSTEVANANSGLGAVLFRANGTDLALGAPPGFATAAAEDVNDKLEIVGWGSRTEGHEPEHGIYWKVTIKATPLTDVKPGVTPNQFVLGAGGLFEVAILGAEDLDPTLELDPSFLTLGDGEGRDTPVARDGSGRWLTTSRNVDGDRRPDLVLQFDQRALEANGDLTARTTMLKLQGNGNGFEVKGQESVVVTQHQ